VDPKPQAESPVSAVAQQLPGIETKARTTTLHFKLSKTNLTGLSLGYFPFATMVGRVKGGGIMLGISKI